MKDNIYSNFYWQEPQNIHWGKEIHAPPLIFLQNYNSLHKLRNFFGLYNFFKTKFLKNNLELKHHQENWDIYKQITKTRDFAPPLFLRIWLKLTNFFQFSSCTWAVYSRIYTRYTEHDPACLLKIYFKNKEIKKLCSKKRNWVRLKGIDFLPQTLIF